MHASCCTDDGHRARRWQQSGGCDGACGALVATRLLHVGNLSEGCLRMAEHLAHPGRNQYLASIKSFFYITKVCPDDNAGATDRWNVLLTFTSC